MDNKTIINGQTIELHDTDRKAAEDFHRNRIAFAWVDGKLEFNGLNDDRDNQHWLQEDLELHWNSLKTFIEGL